MPKFLGVLGYFEQRLVNPSVPSASKLEILLSLKGILRFIGNVGVTAVKHKILSILKTASGLSFEHGSDVLCSLWETFIKTMSISSLGPILSQIVANLYPLLERGNAAATGK